MLCSLHVKMVSHKCFEKITFNNQKPILKHDSELGRTWKSTKKWIMAEGRI